MSRKTLVTILCLALFASLCGGCAPAQEDRVPGEGGAHMGSEQDVTSEPSAAATAESDPAFANAEPILHGPLQSPVADLVEQVLTVVYGDSVLVESSEDGSAAEYSATESGTLAYAVPYLLTEVQAELLFQEFMSRGAERGDPEASGYDCEESSVGFCIEIDADYPTYTGSGPMWLQVDLDLVSGLIRIGHGLLDQTAD